jgi:hypothetical protein
MKGKKKAVREDSWAINIESEKAGQGGGKSIQSTDTDDNAAVLHYTESKPKSLKKNKESPAEAASVEDNGNARGIA